jgi:hypothetical protein
MKQYLRKYGADVAVLITAVVSLLVLGIVQWKVIHKHLVKVGALPDQSARQPPVPEPKH